MRRASSLLLTLSISAACDRQPAPADASSATVEIRVPDAASATASAAPDRPPAAPRIAIHAALGLPELPVGKATRKDFEAKLGAPTEEIKHSTYSITLEFKSGIGATFCQSDPKEIIRWVTFHPPFNGYVESPGGKGPVVLGPTTMREARALRGDCEWTTSEGSPFWSCSYKLGADHQLSFEVSRDLSVPQFPLDEARHLDKYIVGIQVGLDGNCP